MMFDSQNVTNIDYGILMDFFPNQPIVETFAFGSHESSVQTKTLVSIALDAPSSVSIQ